MRLVLKNVKACINEQIVKCNIISENKIISAIEQESKLLPDDQVIEGEGFFALPGMIDIHTHLDDKIGSFKLADTYSSGSRIAIMNGITSIFSFITENSKYTLNNAIMLARNKADAKSLCDYHWHLTPINFNKEDYFNFCRLIEHGFLSYKLYTTYRQEGIFLDYNKIEQFAQFLKVNGGKLLIHCEDDLVLYQNQNAFRFLNNAKSHAQVRPDYAEIKAIDNLITICKKTQVSMHIVHVSSYKSVEMLLKVKDILPISFETCPQYLFLNDDILNQINGYQYICSPPLRSEDNNQRLRYYAYHDNIDCFATDHCAFTKEDKELFKNDFRKVPNGIPGIGALSHLIYNLFEDKGEEAFIKMTKHLSELPAKICDIYPKKGILAVGSDADIVLCNIGNYQEIKATLQDVYNPYNGFKSRLNIAYTIKSGQIAVKDGHIINEIMGDELERVSLRR